MQTSLEIRRGQRYLGDVMLDQHGQQLCLTMVLNTNPAEPLNGVDYEQLFYYELADPECQQRLLADTLRMLEVA